MLDTDTKRRIDNARDILVGKLPDPKSQVEQITIALIYKFMDDMDAEAEEMGGKRTFFSGEFERYGWAKLMDVSLGGQETLNRYGEAIEKMNENQNVPQLFRDIFKNAYLPYRDPETLKMFLKTINEFEYDHSERLGDAFEYLLSVMSSQGDAGQFRTPRHIIDFMVKLVDPKKEERVMDPACGTAGFLISAYKHILEEEGKKKALGQGMTPEERTRLMENFEGYDISPDMVRLSLVNMYLHGFTTPKIHEYDTLTSDDRWNDFADVILANPPFMSPKGGIRPHKRFAVESNRSEVLFVDYIMEHLTPNGRAAIIVPEGVIFQGGKAYKALRKALVEGDYLVGVISLPAGVFNPYSGVKTSILWIDRALAKKVDKIVFCKVEHDGYDLGAQRRPNEKNDLPEIVLALTDYKTCLAEGREYAPERFRSVKLVTKRILIEAGEYYLNQDRYSKSIIKTEKYDWVKLNDISNLFIDGDWIESKDQSTSGIRLIQTGNVGFGNYLDKGNKAKFISEETFKRLKCKEVFAGDILISRLPDPVGRACVVPAINERMITAVDCTIVRLNKSICLPIYFVNITKTDQYYKLLAPFLTGSSRSRISRTNLENIAIPVPSLEVQEEIMAEIEGYQKIIDGARMVVENYRPWIEVDPAWPVVKLGEVCSFKRGPFGGSLKKEIFLNEGFAVYEQKHAIRNDFSSVRYYISKEKFKEMKGFEVLPGDLIMSCSGTMGKVAIVPEGIEPGIINQALLKLTPSVRILKEFLVLIMESGVFQEGLQKLTNGVAIKNVASVQVLKNIQVPIPNIETQKIIVEQIKKEQSRIDAAQELISIFEEKIRARIAKVWGE
jgi:type I restriction enzyme M protein